MRCIYFIFTVLFCFTSGASGQSVFINEIMFDGEGSDYHTEYVEIYNADSVAIDVFNWEIGDQDEVDRIISWHGNDQILLQPGDYLLILDPSYFGNSVIYDSALADLDQIGVIDDGSFGRSGFSNSVPETVYLLNSAAGIVDSVTYSVPNIPGYSDEKTLPHLSGPGVKWQMSLWLKGTPGYVNSVYSPDRILSFTENVWKDSLTMSFAVEITSLVSYSFNLELAYRHNVDEIKKLSDTGQFKPYETAELHGELPLPHPGWNRYRLYAIVDNSIADSTELSRYEALAPGDFILSELMFAPEEGDPEWIELENRTTSSVNLSGSILVLDDIRIKLPLIDQWVTEGGFVIFADFITEEPACQYSELPGWKDLRVGGSIITLETPLGTLIDSLGYSSSWFDADHHHRSIEKKNPDYPNKAGYWGYSRANTGSTPGKVNSWFNSAPEDNESTLRLNSRILSLTGLNGPPELEIRLVPGRETRITLLIGDIYGRIVRVLARDKHILHSDVILWNGCNDNGDQLPSGTYIVTFLEQGRTPLRLPLAIVN